MDTISISMWLLALIMGGIAFFRPGKLHIQGAKIAGENLLVMVPRIIMAILVPVFFPSSFPRSWWQIGWVRIPECRESSSAFWQAG